MGDECGGDVDQGTGIWPLYVGLLLVLLTFFIMLVSLAKPDSGKTSAMVDGLQATFGMQPRWSRDDEGLFASGTSALAELGGDLVGLLRVAHVHRTARGDELTVTLPAWELFPPGGAEVRETCLPFLDRVAAVLGAPPAGVRLELAFSLSAGPAGEWPGGEAGDELPLAIRRVGAFARALVARGAPSAAVAVGIDPGHPGRALFAFRSSAVEQAAQARE